MNEKGESYSLHKFLSGLPDRLEATKVELEEECLFTSDIF